MISDSAWALSPPHVKNRVGILSAVCLSVALELLLGIKTCQQPYLFEAELWLQIIPFAVCTHTVVGFLDSVEFPNVVVSVGTVHTHTG